MSKPIMIRDTSPEAESVLIGILRDKPACMRLRDAVSASNLVAEQCKNAIRRRHPQISEDEVKLRFIELNYGREIANEVRAYLSRK
jgi:hypothetical protein